VTRYIWGLFLTFCVFAGLITLGSSGSFALDPKFELDTKALGSKKPAGRKTAEPQSGVPTSAVSRKKTQSMPRQTYRSKKGVQRRSPKLGMKQLRKSRYISRARTASPGTLGQSFRASTGRDEGIRWTRKVWDRLLGSGRPDPGPLKIQGRNFSLSLDPEQYPVLPAADGGKIVIDTGMTLSPLVKTILREQDHGIRIVSEHPDNRRSFFSSLLAAARFYSVEENFSVDFGSDPKLTVTSDFKIEKTSDSLLKNDVTLVTLPGKRTSMPQLLSSFLEKEGFQVIESSPSISTVPDGRKVLYSVQGSNQESIVDELFSALSVRCEKNRDLMLDDGAHSGVSLSVRADRFSQSNGKKLVFSFSEENPVQYTLLRLLELKGYRVVILNPEDDFKEISEKVLSSLGFPAVYGMQPLWEASETPFNVQISGFVVAGIGRNRSRIFLTNVTIDPLVRELALYQGFDVIVK
jgi:hypothetical protein